MPPNPASPQPVSTDPEPEPAPTTGKHPLHFSVQLALHAPGTAPPSRQQLRAWAACALLGPVATTLRFVDEEEGVQLNSDFRTRGYATNVLTFPYGDDGSGTLTGDIALCWPVVCREAAEQHKPVVAHCAHLVIHGMLHLQGLDHIEEDQAHAMEALETRILAKLGFPDPYLAQAPSE